MTFKLLILSVIGFGLAYAGSSSDFLFWFGIALGGMALSLAPAPLLGYDSFFFYSWLESVLDGGDSGGSENISSCGGDGDGGGD